MTQMMETRTSLISEIDALQQAGRAPDWLSALRDAGAAHFDKVGLPTTKHEEWQQTNVSALEKMGLVLTSGAESLDASDLRAFDVPDLEATTLVFLDGRYQPELSDPLEGKVIATHVPRGTDLDKPIRLLFVSSDSEAPVMNHPRVLVVVESQARASVIEQHVAVGQQTQYFTNAVTEVFVGDNAEAEHVFIEQDTPASYNISTLQIHQGRDSRFRSHTLLYGGKVVRNNVNPTLDGENGWSLLNGLYLPDGDRHMDNHMHVHHTRPHCQSRQFYTGILQDQSSGVFIGRIKVDRPAQQTDAVQSSRNLLMSDKAHAHNRPQLEIFADDVKCTHGSTTGQLDDPSIFYLRSRGISEAIARGMLIYAFANEALERIGNEPLRRYLSHAMIRQLRLGDAMTDLLE